MCSRVGHLLDENSNKLFIIGGAGIFRNDIYKLVDEVIPAARCDELKKHLGQKSHAFSQRSVWLYLHYGSLDAVMHIPTLDSVNELQKELLRALAAQMAVKLHSVNLADKLKRASLKDWLTQLPNRTEFLNRISHYKGLQLSRWGIALIDIRHFSDINSSLGVDIGNMVLQAAATRLRIEYDEIAELGRISGDVFGLVGDIEDIRPEKINHVFAVPIIVGTHAITIKVCVGICVVEGTMEAAQYLRRASVALEEAKTACQLVLSIMMPVLIRQAKLS